MQTLKQQALDVISRLPDEISLDDIIYQPYVIDKIRKGREAVKQDDVITSEDLKKEQIWEKSERR